MNKPLWKGWAVVNMNDRGQWSHPFWARDTRSAAIAEYHKGASIPGEYQRERKRKTLRVKCVRVELREVES